MSQFPTDDKWVRRILIYGTLCGLAACVVFMGIGLYLGRAEVAVMALVSGILGLWELGIIMD